MGRNQYPVPSIQEPGGRRQEKRKGMGTRGRNNSTGSADQNPTIMQPRFSTIVLTTEFPGLIVNSITN